MWKWQKGSWKLRTREGVHDFPWNCGTFHGWGSREHLCPIQALCCPFRHGAVGAHPQCHHWQHVQTWGSSVCFHQPPFICGLMGVFGSFFLPCHQWVFSDVPLGAVSFLAMLNSAFGQTSAYSQSPLNNFIFADF